MKLEPVHFPEAVGLFPLAIGWWITLAVIPILLWISYLIYQRLTRKTALKTAKKLLARLKHDETMTAQQKLNELSVLIRRVAISVSPREQCAGLIGKSWLEYLDKSFKDKHFSQGAGLCLIDSHYRKELPENINFAELFNLTERWLQVQKSKK